MLRKRVINNFEERLLFAIMVIFVIRGAVFILTSIDDRADRAIAVLVYSIFVAALYLKPDKEAAAYRIHAHFGLLLLIAFVFNYFFSELAFLFFILILHY